MSEDYLKKAVKEHRQGRTLAWQNIPDPTDKRRVLVNYDTIPPATRAKLPAKPALLQQLADATRIADQANQAQVIRTLLPPVPKADLETLRAFRIERETADLSTGELVTRQLSGLPEEAIKTYALACRWLAFLSDAKWAKKAERAKIAPAYESKPAFLDACVVLMEEDQVQLPTNYSKLQAKLRDYKEQGAACVISKSWGNNRTRKVGDEQLEYLIKLFSDKRKPSFELVTGWYNDQAVGRVRLGLDAWPEITSGTAKNNLLATDVKPVWYMARHGFDAWKALYQYTMLCYKPSQRDIQWVIDGTKVNKYYRTAKGVAAKLKMVVVMDVASDYFLGWAFAEKEDAQEVGRAVRMAHRRAGGARPYQFLYDNDSSNKLFFKGVAGFHYPAMPYNGQSKTIEGAFGRLQKGIMRDDVNHTGQNIRSRRMDSQANTDGLKPADLPTLAECIAQAEMELHQWNNYKGPKGNRPSPKELYEGSENPDPQFLTAADEVEAFWQWNEQPITYRRDGLRFKKQGIEQVYEVVEEVDADAPGITHMIPDLAFHSRFVGQKFYVKYDPENVGEKIALYVGEDKRFVEFAHSKLAMPRAVYDHKPGDRAAINARLDIKKKQASQVLERQADITARLDAEDIQKLGHRFVSKNVLAAAEQDFLAEQDVAAVPRALPKVPQTAANLSDSQAIRDAKWQKMKAVSFDN